MSEPLEFDPPSFDYIEREGERGHKRPVHRKVYASTVGSSAGLTVSGCLVWAIGVVFYGGDNTAAGAVDAALAVPAPLAALLALIVTAGGTLASGYIAKES